MEEKCWVGRLMSLFLQMLDADVQQQLLLQNHNMLSLLMKRLSEPNMGLKNIAIAHQELDHRFEKMLESHRDSYRFAPRNTISFCDCARHKYLQSVKDEVISALRFVENDWAKLKEFVK